MLFDIIGYLICPNCGSDLELIDGALRCRQGHSYDVARQGYVNLMSAAKTGSSLGDTSAMVDARAEFLRSGHFSPLAKGVAAEAARSAGAVAEGCVVDVGAGTGYYLAEVLESLPWRVGLALDASKYSIRRAARSHSRVGAVVCDAWGDLPVRSGSVAVAINVFAPRHAAELHRILSPEGRLIVVTPSVGHLATLVSTLGMLSVDENKAERLAQKFGAYFDLDRRTRIEFSMPLGHRDIEALVAMGPSAWHTDPGAIRSRIAVLPEPLGVPASVVLSVYEPL